MMQPEQTNELLCAMAQQGDPAAREQLILHNIDFIRGIANKLYFRLNIKIPSRTLIRRIWCRRAVSGC